MIEDVAAYELKCYHTCPDAPAKIILKEPHARVADHKPALPSDVIFQVTIHLHCTNG